VVLQLKQERSVLYRAAVLNECLRDLYRIADNKTPTQARVEPDF
jgi:hypothetical protein